MGKVLHLPRATGKAAPKPKRPRAQQPQLPQPKRPTKGTTPACELGTVGCEAMRIVDWRRCADVVYASLADGTLSLCKQHQKRIIRD